MTETAECSCFLDRMAVIDVHLERTDNPHQVTAEQVDTYSRTEINALLASAVVDLYTKSEVDALLASVGGASTGTVAAFAMVAAPTGWLACDGAEVSRTDYAALFAAVGETYGTGDGSTTFNLPDLRGEFVRGWDNGRGVDADRVLGSEQEDALQNIVGQIKDIGAASSNGLRATGPFYENGGVGDYDAGTDTPIGSDFCNVGFDASRVVRTSTETRPRNVALLYCIKA